MPEFTNMSVASLAGTSDALGTISCDFPAKKSRNARRIWVEVRADIGRSLLARVMAPRGTRTDDFAVPEARRGWGPIPVTEWTESRNWTESTEAREAKRSALLRWARGQSPRRELNERKPARRAGFLVLYRKSSATWRAISSSSPSVYPPCTKRMIPFLSTT